MTLVNGSFFPGRGTLVEQKFLEGKAEGLPQGEVRAWSDAVLRLLDGRRVFISRADSRRIIECTDLNVLRHWFDLAITATAGEELFTGPEVTEQPYLLRGEDDGEARGRAMGRATALLRVLAARGVPVSEAAVQRIRDCTHLSTLDLWLNHVITVNSAEELFTVPATAG